jgi:DNA invertase Pin-like site-specific DNA recombinase
VGELVDLRLQRFGLQQVKWLTRNISAVSSWSTEAPRVAVYLRSAVEDEAYIARRLTEIRQYVEDRDWELAGTYVDNGYSGNSDRRPALLQLRQDIQDGQVDVIIVSNLARLFRSFSRLQCSLRLLQEHRAGLVCL